MKLVVAGLICLIPTQVQAHGAPIIDGIYTGDWCAPAQVLIWGPDSATLLAPPICALGSEIFWDDWDTLNYGPADTIGLALGGIPGVPVPGATIPDPEVDIDFFATTADSVNIFFTVNLGPYPATIALPPHVQIAIDVDGAPNGNAFWYDPLLVGTNPVGTFPLPGLPADYLITTDVVGGVAFVWEAISAPGAWTQVGPTPLIWSGVIPPGPGVLPNTIELVVPWGMFMPPPPPPGLPFVPGTPAMMTVMSAHGAPFMGPTDAPATPADDVFSESGAGFTTSVDLCPPAPFPICTTDCEVWIGPGGGVASADAFIPVLYPTADLDITKSSGVTSVVPGTQVTYTITAGNAAGPSTATGATITDTFPASLSGCTWSCAGTGGGTCTAMGSGNINDSVTLPAGATVTYTATCTLSDTARGNLINTATITPPIGIIEPNTTNDAATDSVPILDLDYGDAPDPTYPTLLATNGARHAIAGPALGMSVDGELDGQPTAMASGDDTDGNDDEDGVLFPPSLVAGHSNTVSVTTTGPGFLDAWVDFDRNGWFDPGEQVHVSVALPTGTSLLLLTPPASTTTGTLLARYRFSSTGGLAPWGLALDGEVEDHQIAIIRSSDMAMDNTDARDPAVAGLTHLYLLTVTNNGPSDASGVTVSNTLPTSITFLGSAPGSPTCTESSGTVTCSLGQIAALASTDVVITVLLDGMETGPLTNFAQVLATEPDPIIGNNSDGESTAVVTPLFADPFETGDDTAWDNSNP